MSKFSSTYEFNGRLWIPVSPAIFMMASGFERETVVPHVERSAAAWMLQEPLLPHQQLLLWRTRRTYLVRKGSSTHSLSPRHRLLDDGTSACASNETPPFHHFMNSSSKPNNFVPASLPPRWSTSPDYNSFRTQIISPADQHLIKTLYTAAYMWLLHKNWPGIHIFSWPEDSQDPQCSFICRLHMWQQL